MSCMWSILLDFLWQGYFGKGILSRSRPEHSISVKWRSKFFLFTWYVWSLPVPSVWFIELVFKGHKVTVYAWGQCPVRCRSSGMHIFYAMIFLFNWSILLWFSFRFFTLKLVLTLIHAVFVMHVLQISMRDVCLWFHSHSESGIFLSSELF